MKKVWVSCLLLITLLAGMTFLTGCESKHVETSGYYIGNWGAGDSNIIYLSSEGTYELYSGIGTEKGEYRFWDGKLELTPKGEGTFTTLTSIDQKYLLGEVYTGEAKFDDRFRGSFAMDGKNGGERLEFYENGNCSKEIYITGLSDQRISGSYTKDGNILRCNFTLYGTTDYYIQDGKLYHFYERKNDFTPTPTPTPSLTPTPKAEAKPNSEATVTEDATSTENASSTGDVMTATEETTEE